MRLVVCPPLRFGPPEGVLRHPPGEVRRDYLASMRADPCAYCNRPRAGTWDHIEPRALGGAGMSADNRTAACRWCNVDKAEEPLLLYLLAAGGIRHERALREDRRRGQRPGAPGSSGTSGAAKRRRRAARGRVGPQVRWL